mmetsp:Transcript_129841/g.416647  ORF Transcript_129841/g.416647 Transcript_129841/m.416647 type:complete len:307 (-) Transcript_129841:627-1547(-)
MPFRRASWHLQPRNRASTSIGALRGLADELADNRIVLRVRQGSDQVLGVESSPKRDTHVKTHCVLEGDEQRYGFQSPHQVWDLFVEAIADVLTSTPCGSPALAILRGQGPRSGGEHEQLAVARSDTLYRHRVCTWLLSELKQQACEQTSGLEAEAADGASGGGLPQELPLRHLQMRQAGRARGLAQREPHLHGAAAQLQRLADVPRARRDAGRAELQGNWIEGLEGRPRHQKLLQDVHNLVASVGRVVDAHDREAAGDAGQQALRQVHRVGNGCDNHPRRRQRQPIKDLVEHSLVSRDEVVNLINH